MTLSDPVCTRSVAWKCSKWLPVSERTTQRSSTQVATCGKSSLTGVPHRPAGANLNCGGRRVFPLYCLPPSAASLGFGSNDSRCETPPVMNRKMTRLALPAKWGVLGARGSASRGGTAPSARSSETIPGSSSEPPISDPTNWRRVGRG